MSKLENGATASMNSNWLHEHDQALREQIAKEIEEYKPLFSIRKKAALDWRWGIEHTKEVAARIARGQK